MNCAFIVYGSFFRIYFKYLLSFKTNVYKILEFKRNNICFSELLILRQKSFADFVLGHWSYPQKVSKNIEKIPYRRVVQKRYNFAPDAANHSFFRLTLYIQINFCNTINNLHAISQKQFLANCMQIVMLINGYAN